MGGAQSQEHAPEQAWSFSPVGLGFASLVTIGKWWYRVCTSEKGIL